MNYRLLGKTGLKISEIGLGGEWLERHTPEECAAVIQACEDAGMNALDCWMSNPETRTKIGESIKGKRERWIVEGHIGSTWQNGQYVVTRDMNWVKPAFEDLLERFHTDYIDLGMIHFLDNENEFQRMLDSDYLKYARELKASGAVRHLGLSTHNPKIAKLAVENKIVELILFSLNPAFDLMPPTDDINDYFVDDLDKRLGVLNPERAELYRLCEQRGVGINVMKGFAGGRLFDAVRSPFGVALTPVQCIHYALTRPAVACVMAGFDTPEQVREVVAYESATPEERDYSTVLAKARLNSYSGQCTYCGHCQPCPKSIDIAMVNKLLDLATMQSEVPVSLKEHYLQLDATGSDCVKCGACEKRCPFQVPVTQRMEKAVRIFGK